MSETILYLMFLRSLPNETKISIVFFVLIGIILGTGYLLLYDPPYSSPLPKEIVIGAVLPLSGDHMEYGTHARDGISLAVADINAAGGIHGKNISMMYYDDSGISERSRSFLDKAHEMGIPVVIGSVISDNTLAMASLAEEYHIILISPTSTTPLLSGYSDWVFRTIASDRYKGRGMIRLIQDMGYDSNTLGIVYQDDAHGRGLFEVVSEVYHEEHASGNLVSYQISSGQTDFSEILYALDDTDIDTVILFAYTPEAAKIINQAEELGLSVTWFSDEAIVNEDFLNRTYLSSEGTMAILASSRIMSPSFIDTFTSRFGYVPDFQSAYGYDTVKIVANAIFRSGYDPGDIRNAIRKTRYLGITGPKSFDENGDIPPVYDVARVQNNNWIFLNRNRLTSPLREEITLYQPI